MQDETPLWATATPQPLLAARRKRFANRVSGTAVLASGWPRARNFPHNHFEYRAESHFLYLLGHSLVGAALLIEPGQVRLFATPPAPENKLWHGPEPTLDNLADAWGLEVLPLVDLPRYLEKQTDVATIPPQDPTAAQWLTELLGRPIQAGAAERLQPSDAALAEALVAERLVADTGAIDQMRQAAAVTARAHRVGMAATRSGDREAHVCGAMRASIESAGMPLAYGPIVTTQGQVLHSHHHHHKMARGDLLLVDVGAETPEGWAADVTRTWPVSGAFSATQRAVYEVVLAAEQVAIDTARVGVAFLDVHRAAQQCLAEGLVDLGILKGQASSLQQSGAVAAFFPHGIGHLIGVDVHDMEDLGDRAGYPAGTSRGTSAASRFLRLNRVLEAGMAVTVEPGFYQIPELLSDQGIFGRYPDQLNRSKLAQFADVQGIRIEDDLLITPSGCEVLSAATPKTVAEVTEAMAG